MYKFITILPIFFILFSCVTNNDKKKEIQSEKFIQENINLDNFYFNIEKDTSSLNQNNYYNINYNIKLKLTGKNYNFIASYKILDKENNVLYSNEKKLPFINKEYIIEDSFTDNFLYNNLQCILEIKYKGKKYEFTSEHLNETLPALNLFHVGPIITAFNEVSGLTTTLHFEIKASNNDEFKKILLIPPSQNQFWELPITYEENELISFGSIVDNEHKDYIDNGIYLLQLHYGKYGIIEKKIEILDLFNNKSGPNYGLPPVSEKSNEKNNIIFDIQNIEKVDYMEIIIYEKSRDRLNKLGSSNFYTIHENFSKKNLFQTFKDDFGNKVKLKYNKEYFYEIYLYSKEFNNLKYMSKSKLYKIEFGGFNFLNF